jgi:hypothetical protein
VVSSFHGLSFQTGPKDANGKIVAYRTFSRKKNFRFAYFAQFAVEVPPLRIAPRGRILARLPSPGIQLFISAFCFLPFV